MQRDLFKVCTSSVPSKLNCIDAAWAWAVWGSTNDELPTAVIAFTCMLDVDAVAYLLSLRILDLGLSRIDAGYASVWASMINIL